MRQVASISSAFSCWQPRAYISKSWMHTLKSVWCLTTELASSWGLPALTTQPFLWHTLKDSTPQHWAAGCSTVTKIAPLSAVGAAAAIAVCNQVCLAAETCGHVDFNTRGDVWYSSEPFHCGDIPAGHVTYWQIFGKVGTIITVAFHRNIVACNSYLQPLTQLQLDASHNAAGTIRALRECWVDGTNMAPVLTESHSSLLLLIQPEWPRECIVVAPQSAAACVHAGGSHRYLVGLRHSCG